MKSRISGKYAAGVTLRVAFASLTVCCALAIGSEMLWATRTAHAQASRSGIVGVWTRNAPEIGGVFNESNGLSDDDTYRFRSNGTYEFEVSPNKRVGTLNHSGTWRLSDGGRILRLHSTRRVVLVGERRRTVRDNRTLRLRVEPTGGNSIRINGENYHR